MIAISKSNATAPSPTQKGLYDDPKGSTAPLSGIWT